jgi:hypothetical protein
VSLTACSDYTLSLSSFSGNVALTLHCPGDIIEPSLWNNRYTCLEYQLCYINLLIQEITNQNPNLGATLSNQYASVTGKLTTLPTVTPGQPVSHEYFNVIYDHVNLAYNTLTYFLNNVLSLTSTQQAQVTPYLNQLAYVINNITRKYAMDLVRASDWNALTNALYAIDQILQFIRQNWIIPVSMIQFGLIILPKSSSIQLSTVTIATVSSSVGWSTG